MTEPFHLDASQHLPSFITAPGETDVLMVVMAIILALGTLGFGLLFLRLHTMPERMAHKSQKVQLQIVAVLGLLALFTHMHIFWVAGLLLALIELPDFGTPLSRIAGSVERIAGKNKNNGDESAPETSYEAPLTRKQGYKPTDVPTDPSRGVKKSESAPSAPTKFKPVSKAEGS